MNHEQKMGVSEGNQTLLRQCGMDYGSNPSHVVESMKRIENKTGVSMKGIQVRMNSPLPAQFQAKAFAQGGNRIEVGPGNNQCINHELGHIVQQRRNQVKPTGKIHNIAINDDQTLEHQATVIGDS